MKTNNKKIEDKFYGKRVVKGIFAKAKFAKMSPEKVKILTEAVQQVVKEKPLITRKYYADHGLSEVRWVFDIFWAAQKKLPTNFLSDLYKDGLHDSHIQTVLKSALKSYSSRTGSKAKFAASKFEVGSTYEMRWDSQNFSHYKVLERTASTVKIEDIGNRVTNPDSSDASMRSKGVVIPQKGETVRVKIHTSGDGEFCFPTGRYSMSPTLKASKKVFARQGSKTKFADDGRAKALVILQQLGGNMFVAMTGAKNLSTESNPPALSMKVGSGAQNKVKHLKVVLDEGSDTYTMIFFDSKGSTIKKVDHVYAEDLRRIFTEVTGFYTSLTRHSRQGSKAKMASQLRKQQPYEVLYYKWFEGVQVNIMNLSKIKNEINAIIASGANPEIEMPKLVKKYGSFSRTGSKAKFAKEYILWALPKGSTDRLDEKVMAEGLYTPAQVDDVKRRASADGWHSFRVVAMMSFDDMTNAFKGKGIKKRSSRTGAKVFK